MWRRPVVSVFSLCLILLGISFTSAAQRAVGLLTNGSFEAPLSSGWTVTGAVGDKRVCDSTTPPATDGSCMFRFKGGAVPTTIKQTLDAAALQILNNASVCGDAFLVPMLFFYPAVVQSDIPTLQLVVKYTNGNSTFQQKLNNRVSQYTVATWNFQQNQKLFVPQDSTFQKITFAIRHTSSSGKLFVDQADLNFEASGPSTC